MTPPDNDLQRRAFETGEVCGRCGKTLAPDETVVRSFMSWPFIFGERIQQFPICVPCWEGEVSQREGLVEGERDAAWREWALYRQVYGALASTDYRLGLCPVATLPCVTCGRPVVTVPPHGQRKNVSCCRRCRDLAYRRPRTERACAVCGTEFLPSRSDARYCSQACRQRAYRSPWMQGPRTDQPKEET